MANQAKKPSTREYSFEALVNAAEGKEKTQRDPAYVFSNGAVKLSTDSTSKGFYVK